MISDNHLGDWGTQFGMIIYGYKHFLDEEAYQQQPGHRTWAGSTNTFDKLMDYQRRSPDCPMPEILLMEIEAELAQLNPKNRPVTKKLTSNIEKQVSALEKKVADQA